MHSKSILIKQNQTYTYARLSLKSISKIIIGCPKYIIGSQKV